MALCHPDSWGTMATAKRGSCLATENNNQEISKLYGGKRVLWKNFCTWHKCTPKFIYETCWVYNHKSGKHNAL